MKLDLLEHRVVPLATRVWPSEAMFGTGLPRKCCYGKAETVFSVPQYSAGMTAKFRNNFFQENEYI